MDKLYCKLDELAKLYCKFDELGKLKMSSMSWVSCTVSSMSWTLTLSSAIEASGYISLFKDPTYRTHRLYWTAMATYST